MSEEARTAAVPRAASDRGRSLDRYPVPIRSDPHAGAVTALLHAVYDGLWLGALTVCSPYWAGRFCIDPLYRRMVRQRLFGKGLPRKPGAGDRRRILIHGVSVGEVKVAGPLIRALAALRPDLEVVISTVTDTGFELAGKLYPELRAVRFPVEPSFVVRRFLRRIQPECVVLVELEMWPNFLRGCNRIGVPLVVVNGRITESSFERYRAYRNLMPQFDRVSLFCVQDETYAARFEELSRAPERITITGSMKADGLEIGALEPVRSVAALVRPDAGQLVVVAGSTHEPEEAMVVRAWSEGAPDARLVLVPRHPERAQDVQREAAAVGARPQLLTHLRASGETPDTARPLIVDTIGELESIYSLADIVFVGGSLVPHGGQNVLEPAAQGRAVLTGPHVANFVQETTLLEDAGACLRVEDEEALGRAIARLASEPDTRERMSRAGLAVVQAQKGATQLTVEALVRTCLQPPPAALDSP